MTIENLIGLAISISIFIYLIYALLKPERL